MTVKIFNIQRFSVYDGPGIRTVVFFCGCNLRCAWCHNPESITMNNQLKYNAEQCINCMKCVEICSNNAHTNENGLHIYDREKCKACLECTKRCYSEALLPVGREVSLEEMQKAIMTDVEYFTQSEGGVTFSGGEPMLQVDFLLEILKFCKENGIHTAVDTAGNVEYEHFEKIFPYCDLFLYDIKAVDNDLHKKLTGVSNERILENIKKLASTGKDIFIRVPVIKGGNYDDMANIVNFVQSLKVKKVEFLAYHELGNAKYKVLGIEKDEKFQFSKASAEEMKELNKNIKY